MICTNLETADRELLAESCVTRNARFVHCSASSSCDARDGESSIDGEPVPLPDTAAGRAARANEVALDVRIGDHIGARELAGSLIDLLLDDECGVWHLDTEPLHELNVDAHRVGSLWAAPMTPFFAAAQR